MSPSPHSAPHFPCCLATLVFTAGLHRTVWRSGWPLAVTPSRSETNTLSARASQQLAISCHMYCFFPIFVWGPLGHTLTHKTKHELGNLCGEGRQAALQMAPVTSAPTCYCRGDVPSCPWHKEFCRWDSGSSSLALRWGHCTSHRKAEFS